MASFLNLLKLGRYTAMDSRYGPLFTEAGDVTFGAQVQYRMDETSKAIEILASLSYGSSSYLFLFLLKRTTQANKKRKRRVKKEAAGKRAKREWCPTYSCVIPPPFFCFLRFFLSHAPGPISLVPIDLKLGTMGTKAAVEERARSSTNYGSFSQLFVTRRQRRENMTETEEMVEELRSHLREMQRPEHERYSLLRSRRVNTMAPFAFGLEFSVREEATGVFFLVLFCFHLPFWVHFDRVPT